MAYAHPMSGGRVDGEEAGAGHVVPELDVAHVELHDLLLDLLERATDLLETDTATVLLVDSSGTDLVARAARGIEEEVRQGVRIRIGTGFAGRIAAEGRPLILDQVDETTVANPILWRKGIRSMLGVPLLADDRVIGVVHVGSLSARAFTNHDAEVLSLVADRVGSAVKVRLLEGDRDAAEAIQRSLLPSAPSSLAEFDCAARYVPAERGGIGGDWYDAFMLDDGEVWVVVGDVAGHGFRSATVMGRIRSAMRAYALLGQGPDEVLRLTDRKMAHFEVGSMATVAIAVFCPPYDDALVALAGHPPFVIAVPGQEPSFVSAAPGPPIGVSLADRPGSTSVPMPHGTVLVGCTDGLFERRGEPLDVGLERVRRAVGLETPAAVCDRVMSEAMESHIPEDDVALLVIRRR